jgi:hypothetical protein
MGLITDKTVPGHHSDKLELRASHLIANKIELRCLRIEGTLQLPGYVAGCNMVSVDHNLGLLGEVGPLVKDRHGSKKKSIRARRGLEKAEHLDCLSQTHFIAKNSASRACTIFAVLHP